MTWDWSSVAAKIYTFVVSLGAELTPDTTSTAWKLTLNQNNFSVSHLKANADQLYNQSNRFNSSASNTRL